MPDDSNPLQGFTEAQLRQELFRRQGKNVAGTNKDWYFFKNDEDGRFCIVHKRLYHMEHCIDDNHIYGLMVTPEEFSESEESIFEYDGEFNEGVQALESYGFTKLDNPYLEGLLVYVPIQGAGWPRIDITADTPEIRELLAKWIATDLPPRAASLPADWNIGAYAEKIGTFAKQNDCTHFVRNISERSKLPFHSADVSVMSLAVANSLPAYPQGYRE